MSFFFSTHLNVKPIWRDLSWILWEVGYFLGGHNSGLYRRVLLCRPAVLKCIMDVSPDWMSLALLLNKAPEYYNRHGPPCPASTVLDSEPTSRLDAFRSEQVWPMWGSRVEVPREDSAGRGGSYTEFLKTIWVKSRGGETETLNQSYQITNSQANDGWVCLCSGFLISGQVGLCVSVNGGDPKFEASLDTLRSVYEKTKEEKIPKAWISGLV